MVQLNFMRNRCLMHSEKNKNVNFGTVLQDIGWQILFRRGVLNQVVLHLLLNTYLFFLQTLCLLLNKSMDSHKSPFVKFYPSTSFI